MSSSPDPLVITQLPTELIMRIIDLTHPSAHADLAYTCKRIAQCSSDVLRRHREAHAKRHTVSDLLPESILHLLRTIVWGGKDAITAWHTRSIEIWGQRKQWQDWVPFMLEPPERFDQTAFPCKMSCDEDEVEDYMRLLEDELHLTPEVRSSCMESLKSGKDDVLKVLVIALCPYLQSLKYVWTHCGPEGDNSLHRLATVIAASKKEGCWPPGLRSLREVAVGVNSGTWLDETREDDVRYHLPETLAELFKLPQIESICYQGLFRGDESEPLSNIRRGMPHADDPTCGLTPGCSSLKHLFLRHINALDEDYRQALLTAPRALKSLAFRGDDELEERDYGDGAVHVGSVGDITDVVDIVRESYSSSLESLMLYDANSYHCMDYDHRRLQSFTNLRHVSVESDDLTEERIGVCSKAFTNPGSYSDDVREAVVEYAISYFPKSMEVLSVTSLDVQESAAATEACMVRLIESGRCPKLQAIYIDDRDCWRPSETLLFQRLIELGQRHNIDVVTASAGNRRRIHQIDFHAPPDYYNLSSGPHARDRDHGEWFFCPFAGKWEPIGCGNCGNCESCFAVYTRAAWETRNAVQEALLEESATAT